MTDLEVIVDGVITVARIVTDTDVVVRVDSNDLPVLDAVGMLTMAVDTLLHPELDPDV